MMLRKWFGWVLTRIVLLAVMLCQMWFAALSLVLGLLDEFFESLSEELGVVADDVERLSKRIRGEQ